MLPMEVDRIINLEAAVEWLRVEVARLREKVDGVTLSAAPVPSLTSCSVTTGKAWTSGRASHKSLHLRTVAEVEAALRTFAGCCDRHADNTACDCLATARRYEESERDRHNTECR